LTGPGLHDFSAKDACRVWTALRPLFDDAHFVRLIDEHCVYAAIPSAPPTAPLPAVRPEPVHPDDVVVNRVDLRLRVSSPGLNLNRVIAPLLLLQPPSAQGTTGVTTVVDLAEVGTLIEAGNRRTISFTTLGAPGWAAAAVSRIKDSSAP